MAEDYKKSDDHKPRRLGEYLTCSRGSIVMAMKKKLEALEHGANKKGLGEFLLELGIISQDELDNALRRQRADRIALCPVFNSLTNTELHAIGNHFIEVGIGSGSSSRLWCKQAKEFHGVDISKAIYDVSNNLKFFCVNPILSQADINNLPYRDESFDVIVSNGVFHHTPNTKTSLKNSLKKLKVGGFCIFYIYIRRYVLLINT